MGIALADAASEYGATVDLVLGPVNILPSREGIYVTSVTTAESMATECISLFPGCDVAILSAAVADFTPVSTSAGKIKKDENGLVVKLKTTTDIAATLGKMKKASQLLVGFALETDNGMENARKKLETKNLDLIVLNSLSEEGAGFEHDTNRIAIIDRNNNIDKFELKSKEEVARDILDKIVSMLKHPEE
jgi:phosphopantothenoylcysteine decarboxylase/phosphopantothenate--cysteine ligase